jgi:multimeric flavodoxin WrbA
MKVLAINSSPRRDKGNTALILNPFLDGMKEEGADVELFYTSDLKIYPCHGDFNCWTKTPGKCSQKDDMSMINKLMSQAEILVLASPIYCDGVTGPMKMLMDRTVPQAQPFFELRDDHTRHPLRDEVRRSKIVLVSNSGLWELDNFDAMLTHMKAFSKNANAKFAGALLRPHGEAMRPLLEMRAPVKDVLDAAKEAGRQLVRDGEMSPETLKIVSRELLPRDMYIQMVNQYFQEQQNELEKKG